MHQQRGMPHKRPPGKSLHAEVILIKEPQSKTMKESPDSKQGLIKKKKNSVHFRTLRRWSSNHTELLHERLYLTPHMRVFIIGCPKNSWKRSPNRKECPVKGSFKHPITVSSHIGVTETCTSSPGSQSDSGDAIWSCLQAFAYKYLKSPSAGWKGDVAVFQIPSDVPINQSVFIWQEVILK